MKKNQKRSNLGRLVLTCKNYEDLRRQVQDDTELLGKEISGLIGRRCIWQSPYDQEVLTNVLTTILACVTELAERDGVFLRDTVVEKYDAWLRDGVFLRDTVVEKYDAWLELYRSKNKEKDEIKVKN